jgi:prepilin-type N-terminal cleavage/methylation domain-containing protein
MYRQLTSDGESHRVSSRDPGLTLVEILIAMIILATLTTGISALITNSSRSLEKSSESSLMTRQVLRFINSLRYDVASSYDVIVFSNGYLFTKCSPPLPQSAGINGPENGEQRAWFRVDIKELRAESPESRYTFIENPQKKWAIYSFVKIRQANDPKPFWYISRSLCDASSDSGSFETSHEILLKLGENLDQNMISSQNLIRCDINYCQVGQSTALTKRYNFGLPIGSEISNSPLREFITKNLSNLSPRILGEVREDFGDSS